MPRSGRRCSKHSGRREPTNYSIYLHADDLFGVLEVDDFARFRAMMDGAPVNARWQAEMAALIDPASILQPASMAAWSRCSVSIEPRGNQESSRQ